MKVTDCIHIKWIIYFIHIVYNCVIVVVVVVVVVVVTKIAVAVAAVVVQQLQQ
jgi:hypothetical protein